MSQSPVFRAISFILGLIALELLISPLPTALHADAIYNGTQQIGNTKVTAGAIGSTTIVAGSGQYACVTGLKVHLAHATAVVDGQVTLSDGTVTYYIEITDSATNGLSVDVPFDPPLQSTGQRATWTASVPALSGGGAGDVWLTGYLKAVGC